MKNNDVRVEDIDGYHQDSWCAQLLRARVTSERDCGRFFAEIWIPESPDKNETSLATLSIEGGDPLLFNVAPGAPTRIDAPIRLQAGQEFSFKLFCNNRVVARGEDRRNLSFVLIGLSVE